MKVVEKPEVRKAGGVYYTPEYIVRSIVENTVGKLIAGKTPDQIAEMRFADIACGSGAFLLGVFDLLLSDHGRYYNDNPRKARKGDCTERDGKLHLSLGKKREILLNNIYGVDIDAQAVKVCRLSLSLRLLQEETKAGARACLLDFERAARVKKLLPDLGNNVACGNSLVGTDVLDGRLFGTDEKRKLNPMNFEDAFPEVMKRGGFDAVVGNPPYRRELDYKHLLDQIALGDFGRKHRSPRMDLWYYFIHRGLEILKPGGLLSFIVNAYWTSGTGAEKLIAALRDSAHLDEVFSLGKLKVFRNVSGRHMILRVSNAPSSKPAVVRLARPRDETAARPFVLGAAPVEAFHKTASELFRHGKVDLQPPATGLLAKVERGTPLAELGIIRQGIAENPASVNRKTNERFGGRWQVGEGVFALRPAELRRLRLSKAEQSLLRPYHDLCDLGRYLLADRPSLGLIYSTRNTCPDIEKHPRLHAHLKRFRPVMEQRRETQHGANSWWHLHWPRDERVWQAPKIVALQMANRPSFAVARRPVYVPFSANVFVPKPGISEDLNYFAGLLNSRLLWSWYSHYAKRRGVGLEINGNVLARTPIRRIDVSDAGDKSLHDEMVARVEAMLEAKKQLAKAKTDKDKTCCENKCAALDRQIDRLVYDLYGLTEDEIRIVEQRRE
jgi:adenine-specific DNA-methyltransferase